MMNDGGWRSNDGGYFKGGHVARNEFLFGGRALAAPLRPHLKKRADACLYF